MKSKIEKYMLENENANFEVSSLWNYHANKLTKNTVCVQRAMEMSKKFKCSVVAKTGTIGRSAHSKTTVLLIASNDAATKYKNNNLFIIEYIGG